MTERASRIVADALLALQIVLVAGKLMGELPWAWWQVLVPTLVPAVLAVVAVLGACLRFCVQVVAIQVMMWRYRRAFKKVLDRAGKM